MCNSMVFSLTFHCLSLTFHCLPLTLCMSRPMYMSLCTFPYALSHPVAGAAARCWHLWVRFSMGPAHPEAPPGAPSYRLCPLS